MLIVILLTGCQKKEAPAEEALRPVRYFSVAEDQVGRNRSFSGTLKSTQESRLSFKVSGTVTSVPAQIGQHLKKGDLIAQVDAANFSLQAEQAQASLVEAQAGERNANSNYERTKGLYANDNASLNDLDSARAGAEAAKAQYQSLDLIRGLMPYLVCGDRILGLLSSTMGDTVPGSNGSPKRATYTVTPLGGSWDATDAGTYTIGLNGSEVLDVLGASVPGANPLTTFHVIPGKLLNESFETDGDGTRYDASQPFNTGGNAY